MTAQVVVTSPSLPAGQGRVLATAVTIDLVVGLPLLGHLHLSRRAGWSHLVVGPLLLVGLGVLGWRRAFAPPDRAHAFSYLQRSGYTAVFAAMVAAAAIEAVAVHLLVSQWSHTAAWVVTGLTIYSVVWLAGDYHALRLAPHVVRDGALHLRIGLRMAADVPLDLVEQAQRWTPGTTADATFVPVGAPSVAIVLREPVEVRRLFGRRGQARTLGVAVDDVAAFLDRVRPAPDR